jgi:hypothetical protein
MRIRVLHRPDGGPRPQRATVAGWCQAASAALAIATLAFALADVISAQQAVAMGLLAVVLAAGGLIAVSVADPQTAARLGFQAGLRTGALVRVLRSLAAARDPRRSASPAATSAAACAAPAPAARSATASSLLAAASLDRAAPGSPAPT